MMSVDKLNEILDLYEKTADEIIGEWAGEAEDGMRIQLQAARKVRDMIPRCREYLQEGRREKVMRWLGFMQGVWFASDVYSVDDLKRHNMPPGEEFKR